MPKDNKFYRKLYPQIIDDIEVSVGTLTPAARVAPLGAE